MAKYKKKTCKRESIDLKHRKIQPGDTHANSMHPLHDPVDKLRIEPFNEVVLTASELELIAEECSKTHNEVMILPKIRPRKLTKDDYVVPEGYEAIYFNGMGTNTALFFPIDKPEPEPIKELTRWQKIQKLPTKLWHWLGSKIAKAYKTGVAVASQLKKSPKLLCLKVKTLLQRKHK